MGSAGRTNSRSSTTHGPSSRSPLDAFAGATQHRFEDKQHVSYSSGEPVLSSYTMIFRLVSGEEFDRAVV